MGMNKSIFTKRVKSIIESTTINNPIFVFLGITEYIDLDEFKSGIYDYDTFLINGNENIFNQIHPVGGFFMNIVVVRSPKYLRGLLRRVFGMR